MSKTSGADGPEDVDATFERIVADLRAEGLGSDSGEVSESGTTQTPEDAEPDAEERSERRRSDPARWRDNPTDWDETMLGADPATDDEHFVPLEPPPLPRPRKGAFVVLLFFVVGLFLLIAPGLIGLNSTIGTPLGMLALAIGIALLLLRVKQGPPDGADPSNGAQV
jgi:hypothetical protein